MLIAQAYNNNKVNSLQNYLKPKRHIFIKAKTGRDIYILRRFTLILVEVDSRGKYYSLLV